MTLTPALAVGLLIWTRHRQGIVLALSALAVTAAIEPSILRQVHARVAWAWPLSTLPWIYIFSYFMNLLLLVDDVGNFSSGFPRRMYTLPVRTRALVGWPMLYGGAVVALLWAATAFLVGRSGGIHAPYIWPALGIAATLAWLQAFSWAPFANPWVRVVLMTNVVFALATLPAWLLVFGQASSASVTGLLLAYLPAAFGLAVLGVASDRRGETWRLFPDWVRGVRWPMRLGWRRRPFGSPGGAQFGYEWSCHGWVLPGSLTLVAGLFLLMVAVTPQSPERFRFRGVLAEFITTPLILASSMGAVLGRMRPFWVNPRGPITFVVIRPITTGDLVAAKFRMAAWSVALGWGVAVVGFMLCVVVSGNVGPALNLWQALVAGQSAAKIAAVLILGSFLTLALTWKQATDGVIPALTGRRWVADGFILVQSSVLLSMLLVGLRIPFNPGLLPRLIATVPWVLGLTLTVKGAIAGWAFREALRRRLIGRGVPAAAFAFWLVMVACAWGLSALLRPEAGSPHLGPLEALGVAAFAPMGRFALAPLALDWNRHR